LRNALAGGYVKLPGGIILRERMLPLLPAVDALLFDVDGVLIDSTASFRRTICQTAQYYLVNCLGFTDDALAINLVETGLFKMAGGFNNDWLLTEAVVRLYLYKKIKYGSNSLRELKKLKPSFKEFTASIRAYGGGIKGALASLSCLAAPDCLSQIDRQVDYDRLTCIYKEIYAGIDYCERIYNFKPRFVKAQGLIHHEKRIIDPAKIPLPLTRLGIITGRSHGELNSAFQLLDLAELFRDAVIIAYDDGWAKPDPQLIIAFTKRIKINAGIYVGDAIDDFETVQNYLRIRQQAQPMIYFCGVLSGGFAENAAQIFQDLGADIIAPNVNILFDLLQKEGDG